jgi:hypothetical protein
VTVLQNRDKIFYFLEVAKMKKARVLVIGLMVIFAACALNLFIYSDAAAWLKERAIFNAHFKAIGGKSDLQSLKFLTRTGRFYHFVLDSSFNKKTIEGRYKMQVIYPDKIRISVITPEYKQIEIYNRGEGWKWDQGLNKFIPVSEKEREVLALEAKMAGRQILSYKKLFKRLKFAGLVEEKGKYNKIVGVNKEGNEEVLLFDEKTGLLRSWEKQNRMRKYFEYTKSGRLFFPRRIEELIDKRVTYRIYITSIDFSTPPPDAVFSEPEPADITGVGTVK